MKSLDGLIQIVKKKNEKIKSAVKRKPSTVNILNKLIYASSAASLYWTAGYLD